MSLLTFSYIFFVYIIVFRFPLGSSNEWLRNDAPILFSSGKPIVEFCTRFSVVFGWFSSVLNKIPNLLLSEKKNG